MKEGSAYFDQNKLSLLVPIQNKHGQTVYIPFHLYTIKNVFLNCENKVVYLRVNFHTPLQYGKDIVVPVLDEGMQTIFVKEITLKSESGGSKLQEISKQIKESLKLLKTSQSFKEKNPDARDEDLHLASQNLAIYTGSR